MKILYIIGPTRSGSTLLSRVLNEAPGIVAVGEVVSLDVAFQSCRAQRLGASASGNFVGNDARENAARRFSGLCGCGCPLTDCTVWAHVDRTVFGDPPDYSPWSWTASRPPLRTFLHNGADRWLQSVGTDLAPVAESIYRELARATDARVLVDDSKTPLFGYFLAAQPWAEVIPVRLVRDPRATADSWARPKPYPGMLGGHFPTHPAHVSAVDWLKRVVLADRLFRGRGPVLRFEDFVKDPLAVATRLVASTGIDARLPAAMSNGTLHFGENHIIAGNPDKLERGDVAIRPTAPSVDDRRRWAVVSALTLPELRRYRYPITFK